MDGAKSRRRGQDNDSARCDGIDGLLVGIHAEQPPVPGDVQLPGESLGETLEAGLQAIVEDIRHREKFSRPLGREGVDCSAGSASAAPDQSYPDSVLLGRIGPRANGASERRAS
ncbi:MAG: hypothetical protein IIC00_06225 [Planctomycetes bacterium]|nr:hypothetical protein [Planctomycetota bacterium]